MDNYIYLLHGNKCNFPKHYVFFSHARGTPCIEIKNWNIFLLIEKNVFLYQRDFFVNHNKMYQFILFLWIFKMFMNLCNSWYALITNYRQTSILRISPFCKFFLLSKNILRIFHSLFKGFFFLIWNFTKFHKKFLLFYSFYDVHWIKNRFLSNLSVTMLCISECSFHLTTGWLLKL